MSVRRSSDSRWTWDAWSIYPENPVTDPLGPEGGGYRVRRGCGTGAYGAHGTPYDCRVARRQSLPAKAVTWNNYHISGMRLARTLR